ncbi:unnamed protein product [Rotaria sordida]|uniref:O-acyltransferase WSD1 C-terminal domain-containing protein n=1 Tax=Rotaria sordida TaxID=392033 RepID=A0A815SM60_9BILA|nr:unnamed protein product [Rotaria sordida]
MLGSAANALMQGSQNYQGFAKIGEVLHLDGPRISLEALSTAVSHLQRRHPVLRSRLQINPEKPNSYLLEEDDTLQLKIREISRKRADHLTYWRREWREREKETVAIVDMTNYCHTEISYGSLDKEITHELVEKCRRESVTVTSAVNSAMLCAITTLVSPSDDQRSALQFSIGADTRRRCIPSVPNHDLSYQVSCILPFTIPKSDIPTDCEGMWHLARTLAQYMKTSIDANQILAIGIILGKLYQKMFGPPDLSLLPTYGNSSWGILPFRAQYTRWQFTGMTPFMNSVRGTTPFTMIQTVNGILTIIFIGNDPVLPLKIIDDFRDRTMQKLHQMIAD